ncbi:MAG: ATPase, partial [Fischerella sp.]|nr:ATPase [Fischerella sp.]
MNASFVPDLSIYQLTLEVQMIPSQVLSLTPATLLSLLKSQIDLLIEKQIAATLLVKLPPGKIWHSEIQRYRQQFGEHGVIYYCQVAEKAKDVETRGSLSGGVEGEKNYPSQKCLEFLSNSQIRRCL